MRHGSKTEPQPSPWLQSREKRFYDVAGALGALMVAGPIILASAAITYLRDRQNPFFIQSRLGRAGEAFPVYKLRTLRGTEDYGGIGQGPKDDRATRFGSMLRKYAFDELPQLWNVLKGDMSFVGPRPPCDGEVEAMQATLPPQEFEAWEHAYTATRPGLISRYAVETRMTPMEERDTPAFYRLRIDMDRTYAAEASRMLDLRLCRAMFATAREVVLE